ncbi:ATP-binding cassette domain-containing protein [Arthrobacter silvisoli]|uniref:ATP-binding cassette domain-containing protein n=1 Tax=Arthrobacter silvisoli TaxID=2291022 RepID=UPI00109B8128|nr:ATP-binding cassette domain-containing protein [Arthrobacter silvisoli]
MPDHHTARASAITGSHPVPGQGLVTLRDACVFARDGRTLLTVPALTVLRGERLVITGPTGSGKSLLLATLAGSWAPGISFRGERTAYYSRVGFVPQRGLDALHPLIPLGRQLRRVTGATAKRVTEVLEAAGLSDAGLQHRRPAELSGGQAQRAAVALAALTDAPLVLADEPTSALDHESRDVMLQLLDTLIGPERTLVLSTHDDVVAETLGTRRLQVSSGKVTESMAAAPPVHAPDVPGPGDKAA